MAAITVIGEIGGTSSRWAFLGPDGTVRTFPNKGEALSGFNPLNGDADLFVESVTGYFRTHFPNYVDHHNVQVYGAGCGSANLRNGFRSIGTDLAPATLKTIRIFSGCNSLRGSDPGLVLIVGTGMSVGFWMV